MKKSDCKLYQDDGFYELYIDELLEPDEKIEIEDHLTSCSDCREYFERMKNMETFLTTSLSSESIPDLEDRIIHQFRKKRQPQPSTKRQRREISLYILGGKGL